MITQIKTYNDLLVEKERLQLLLKQQKEIVRLDIQEIKAELAPLKQAVSFIGKLGSRDKSNPLLNATSNTLINLVVKRLLLAKTGWITRAVVPFIIKNYSSHVLADNKGKIFKKIFSLFGGKKDKTKKSERPEYNTEPADADS